MPSKEFPIEEFIKLSDAILPLKVVAPKDARRWLATGKYSHGIKRGKFWLVHPDQFRQWWIDGGPLSD